MKNKKKFKKKVIILGILLVLAIVIIIFGAKLYLLVNMLIGNDVLVRVNADKENLFLYHNKSEVVKIKTDVLANPFCTVYCNYTFKDISSNLDLDFSNFTLKSLNPLLKEFNLTAPSKGEGQRLYRFEIHCSSKKTYLCDTSQELKSRTLLLTLNYNLTQEELSLKQSEKQTLIQTIKQLDYIKLNLALIDSLNSDLENYIDYVQLNSQSSKLRHMVSSVNLSIIGSELLFKDQNYKELEDHLMDLNSSIDEINSEFLVLNNAVYNNLTFYNIISDKIEMIRYNLRNIENSTFSNATLIEVNKTVYEFNNLDLILNKNSTIFSKARIITDLETKTFSLLDMVQQDKLLNLSENTFTQNLNNLSLVKKSFKNINSSIEPLINEPESECCLFGECEKCCDDSCISDKSNYPIVFVPGHIFNKEVSSDYIFHSFNEIQTALEKDGYLNAGSVFTTYSSQKGVWGKVNSPLTVGSSYYFDILKNTQGETLFESKTDNLDTYAIRLNDLIKTIKLKTNKDKVVIITHSMGGLVARRYLQIFGDDSVSKLIMITSPNKGISGSTSSYCPIFGSKVECNDMEESSLFINKVSNGEIPKIPVYNIIGIGCDTDGEVSDGVIKNRSAYLDFASNYYINGTCNSFKFEYFHVEILKTKTYPQLLEMIKKFLKE